MLHKAEHYRGRVVRPDALVSHDALQNGSLLDGANVNCGLESSVDAGRVEEDVNRCLEKESTIREIVMREPQNILYLEEKCGLRSEMWVAENHAFSDVWDLNVKGD